MSLSFKAPGRPLPQSAVPPQDLDAPELPRHPGLRHGDAGPGEHPPGLPRRPAQLLRHRGDRDRARGDLRDPGGLHASPGSSSGASAAVLSWRWRSPCSRWWRWWSALRPRRTLHLFNTWPGLIIPHMCRSHCRWRSGRCRPSSGRSPLGDGAGRRWMARRRGRRSTSDRPAGCAGCVHRCDPDLLLRLERVRACDLASPRRPRPAPYRRSSLLRRTRPVSTLRTGCASSVVVTVPIIIIVLLFPAKDRRRSHLGAVRRGDPVSAIDMVNIVKAVRRRLPRRGDVSIDVQGLASSCSWSARRGAEIHAPTDDLVGLEDITSGDMMIGDRRVSDLAPRDHNPGHGVPELRALPAPHGLREHRVPLRLAGPRTGRSTARSVTQRKT